jgi:hypothetical protein
MMPRAAGVSVVCEDGVKVPSFPRYALERIMATLTARKFSTSHGADDALTTLEKLHGEMLIKGTDGYGQPRLSGRGEL